MNMREEALRAGWLPSVLKERAQKNGARSMRADEGTPACPQGREKARTIEVR